jgi:hypothetical protein
MFDWSKEESRLHLSEEFLLYSLKFYPRLKGLEISSSKNSEHPTTTSYTTNTFPPFILTSSGLLSRSKLIKGEDSSIL